MVEVKTNISWTVLRNLDVVKILSSSLHLKHNFKEQNDGVTSVLNNRINIPEDISPSGGTSDMEHIHTHLHKP